MENKYSMEYKDLKELKSTAIIINSKKIKIFNKSREIAFDLSSINEREYKSIIKKFYRLKDKIIKNNNEAKESIKIYLCGFDEKNKKHVDLKNAVTAIMQPTKHDMYNYIYDTVCDYLDNCFINENICNFEDNRCIAKRGTTCTVGCCRHFKHKRIGPLLPKNNLVVCEYLKDKRCTAKCISCKLFTCGYLNKKGIAFKIKDIFLLDVFFNPIQKYYIKFKVFTPKEEIMKKMILWS